MISRGLGLKLSRSHLAAISNFAIFAAAFLGLIQSFVALEVHSHP